VGWLGSDRPEAALLPEVLPVAVAAVLAAIGLATLAASRLAAEGRLVGSAVALAGAFGLGGLALSWGVLPMLDPLKSVRPIARRYLELAGEGEPYGFFPAQEAALQFYTERLGTQLSTAGEVRDFLAQPGKGWIFVEQGSLDRLDPDLRAVEVARSSLPRRGYVLLAERPSAE
jgi:hypothetical protein